MARNKSNRWMLIVALALVLILALVAFFTLRGKEDPPVHRPPGYAADADNTTPAGAVSGLISAVRDWDQGIGAQIMAQLPESLFSDTYREVLAPVLSMLEYETGEEAVDKKSATVQVTVKAVDVSLALGDLAADASSYLLRCALMREDPDWNTFLADQLASLDPQNLRKTERECTVYLVIDASGKWRLDTTNPRNREFYNALTGGVPETLEKLSQMKLKKSEH